MMMMTMMVMMTLMVMMTMMIVTRMVILLLNHAKLFHYYVSQGTESMASEGASSVTSAKRFARKLFQKSVAVKNLPGCKGFSVAVWAFRG